MSHCIFCDILAGKAPASIVYRDDVCCAFMDIHQLTHPGHVLVIPTVHAPFLADLDEGSGAHMFLMAQRIAKALRNSALKCEGVNLYLADGVAAGQQVFHVHLHLIPRHTGDEFGLRLGPNFGSPSTRADLDDVAAEIRSVL